MEYEIFANHAHVFQKSVREDGTVEALKQTMEYCGIHKAVAFAPFSTLFDSSGGTPNDWLEKQLRGEDNLIGFGTIDFAAGNYKEQVKRIHGYGFKGIKMHPAFQKFRVDCDEAFQVYGSAQEMDLAISFHTGTHWHRLADYHMLLFDEVAYHFPNLRYSLEHVGGYSFFQDGVAILINNPKNVYAGLTSVFDRGTNRFWFLSDNQILDLIWLTGDDRSIFGLDFPYNDRNKIKDAINHLMGLDLSFEIKQKILGENIKRFLSIG